MNDVNIINQQRISYEIHLVSKHNWLLILYWFLNVTIINAFHIQIISMQQQEIKSLSIQLFFHEKLYMKLFEFAILIIQIDWLWNQNENFYFIKILSHSDFSSDLTWDWKLSSHRDLISFYFMKKFLISSHKKKLSFWFCSISFHDFSVSFCKRELSFWFCFISFHEKLISSYKNVISFQSHLILFHKSMISFQFWLEIRMRQNISVLT